MLYRNKYILISTIGLIIVAAGGYYIWDDLRGNFNSEENIPQNSISKEDEIVIDGNATSTPEFTITPVPVGKPVPALPYPPEIKANLSAESKVLAIAALKEIIAALRRDPNQPGYWIDLGLQRNFIGDYTGAIEAWEYAAYLRPDDYIPHHNLGDLYSFALNNYAKSEASYKESIRRDPTATMVYQKLHELYRFKLKDNAKARAILEEGIAKNPTTNAWLKKLLAEFEAEIAI